MPQQVLQEEGVKVLYKNNSRAGKFLKFLAGKVGAALRGILGCVSNFLLRTAAQVVEFVAQHLYLGILDATAVAVAYIGKTKR